LTIWQALNLFVRINVCRILLYTKRSIRLFLQIGVKDVYKLPSWMKDTSDTNKNTKIMVYILY